MPPKTLHTRCVVMVGLPYPDCSDPELIQKMEYLDSQQQQCRQQQQQQQQRDVGSGGSSVTSASLSSSSSSAATASSSFSSSNAGSESILSLDPFRFLSLVIVFNISTLTPRRLLLLLLSCSRHFMNRPHTQRTNKLEPARHHLTLNNTF